MSPIFLQVQWEREGEGRKEREVGMRKIKGKVTNVFSTVKRKTKLCIVT